MCVRERVCERERQGRGEGVSKQTAVPGAKRKHVVRSVAAETGGFQAKPVVKPEDERSERRA